MNLSIRRAQVADAQALLDLRKAAILGGCVDFYPHEVLLAFTAVEVNPAFLAMLSAHFYVAEREGGMVGCGMIDLQSGQIDGIFVHPDVGGRGVGRAMMAHLEKLARDAGLRTMTLDSTLNAAPFYRHLGFTGERESVYVTKRGLRLACVPMVKALGFLYATS